MLKTFLPIMILTGLLSNTGLSAQSISKNGYPEHFAAGAVIGGTVSYFVYKKTDNKWKAMATGLLASTGAGVLKELADPVLFNGTRNWKDFGYTALGGVLGVSIVIPLKSRKAPLRDK